MDPDNQMNFSAPDRGARTGAESEEKELAAQKPNISIAPVLSVSQTELRQPQRWQQVFWSSNGLR